MRLTLFTYDETYVESLTLINAQTLMQLSQLTSNIPHGTKKKKLA